MEKTASYASKTGTQNPGETKFLGEVEIEPIPCHHIG